MIAQPSRFQVEDHPDRRDIAELEDRLYEYNARRPGVDDGRWLAIFVRDDAKAIVAGLHGWTWGDCLYVQTLWVREHLRRQGYGARLMRAAEAEAVSRGCERALLLTHDYQAPAFYRKLGWQVMGELEGYPGEHTRIFLRRDLRSAAPVV